MVQKKKQIVYDEKTIQTLDALEHIRLRTGMYIGRIGDGSNPADGIYVMLKEVIDNAVDEFIMGHGKRVIIRRHGPEVSVRDYGRGIPLGKVIDCVSKINTGGKYNDDVFQFSVGLNGVGNKAVNALSSEFEVISYRDGKFKRGLFSQGKKKQEKGGKIAKERNGTMIRFIPDPEIFEDYGWQEEYLEHRLRYYAFLNSGLILDYNGEKYVSKNGLADLLAYELGGEPAVYDAFHCKLDRLEFAFTHTHAYGETYYSFVNGQYTNDGGTHQSAFREGVLKGVNEFSKNGFAGEDVRDGLVGAVAVKVQDPVFESQTKNKLGSTEIRSWVVNSVKEQVVLWLHKNPTEAEKLLEKVKNNQRIRKELSAIKKEARERAKKVAIRIPKLIDCKVHLSNAKGKRREESTIFITEGDSAGGAMIQARDVQTQAIYSLKGKPLNTHGLGREAVYKNEELYNIMRALGVEEGLEGLRYNKVVIATDADVDGMHIRNLLLTYFLRFFEELVVTGHVYILETPIFRVRNKKETVYCYSDSEREDAAERLRNNEVTRFKGLGEISPKEFKQFIADDEHMKRVTPGSMGDVKRALDFFMGKNTPARKEYIIENLIADIAKTRARVRARARARNKDGRGRGRGRGHGRHMTRIEPLMGKNFIEYASYVIVDRAIPDIRDGLKPVQRRILATLSKMDDGKFHKVANVIGDTMKLHPHGDASIGEALVVLANKDFFIEKQGNFGNPVTGHSAAAPRYIECRLTELAKETLFRKALTEYRPSYDGRNEEPVALPAKLPVLLMLGAEGIAVGMSTRILPHNLPELLEAQIKILKNEPIEIYPDFPTGGIVDVSDYDDGRGKVKVRARVGKKDSKTVVIREIAFGTTTESVIASIENASQKGKLKVGSIDDFTTDRVEIEVGLPRGVYADEVIPQLFAHTDCEVSLSSNMVMIKDRQPVEMGVSEVLCFLTDQLRGLIRAELQFELGQLEDRKHWLDLERIFIENRIYKRIEDATTAEQVVKEVKTGLKPFLKELDRKVTDEDIDRLLKIPIRRISQYDIDKNRSEIEIAVKGIRQIKGKLRKLTPTTIKYLEELLKNYGDRFPRQSEIGTFEAVDVRAVSRQNIKLSYDPDTGFFGSEVKGSKYQLTVSEYDRVLLVSKDGSFRIIGAEDKILIPSKLIHAEVFDQETGASFTVVYRDNGKITWGKKIHIKAFIRDREYELIKGKKGKIDFLIPGDCNDIIHVDYVPMKRQRVHEAEFDLSILEIIGVTARGRRLAPKPAAKVKRIRTESNGGNVSNGEDEKPVPDGEDVALPFEE